MYPTNQPRYLSILINAYRYLPMSSEYLKSAKNINAAVQELLQYPHPNIKSFAAAQKLPYRRLLYAYKGHNNCSTRAQPTKRLIYD